MLDPGGAAGFVDLPHVGEIVADARDDQRMRIRGVDQSEAANPGAGQQVFRQDRRAGVLFLEILEDGQRLEQLGVAVIQGRHQGLRVLRLVLRLELVAAIEVDGGVLARQAFEVVRDADAKRRLRASRKV